MSFPTSRQVYNQILWHPKYDQTQFKIGLFDRAGYIVEIAFSAWNPSGDIPWHRIQYFRQGTTKIWDRKEKLFTLTK